MSNLISIIDDMKLWDKELEAEVKRGIVQRITTTKQDIFNIARRHNLVGPDDILLHNDSQGIGAEPYRTWWGKVKFVHPERLCQVKAWLLYSGAYKFALLADGDIADYIYNVPIANSDESMGYYQAIDLYDARYQPGDLKIILTALSRHLVIMQRFDS